MLSPQDILEKVRDKIEKAVEEAIPYIDSYLESHADELFKEGGIELDARAITLLDGSKYLLTSYFFERGDESSFAFNYFSKPLARIWAKYIIKSYKAKGWGVILSQGPYQFSFIFSYSVDIQKEFLEKKSQRFKDGHVEETSRSDLMDISEEEHE